MIFKCFFAFIIEVMMINGINEFTIIIIFITKYTFINFIVFEAVYIIFNFIW